MMRERRSSPRVTVLHEYGAWDHFLPHRWLDEAGEIDLRLHAAKFARRFARAVREADRGAMGRVGADLGAFVGLLLRRGDTVVVGFAPLNWAVLYLAVLNRRHHVVYMTSWARWESDEFVHNGRSRLGRSAWRAFVKGIRAVAVNTSGAQQLRAWGADAVRIPHPVDDAFLTEPPSRKDRTPVRVVFVGRLVPEKGVDLLETVVRRHPELAWTFVGTGSREESLRRLADEGHPVEVTGRAATSVLVDRLDAADIFVLPSYRTPAWEETFGIAIVEAMARGLPVVVTDCVGPREIVTDGVEGIVVPQHDLRRLEDAIATLAAHPQLRAEMGAAGRKAALTHYSTRTVAEAWRAVLLHDGGPS